MAFHLFEDTWETSTTTGTGDYILAGAASGWRAFSAQYSNADTTWYAAYDGSNFEQGLGTYNSGANSVTRTTIYRSTNGGAAVNWAAGTRNIVVAPLGIVLESHFTPGSTGIPNRTADNTWAYLPYSTGTWTPIDSSGASLSFTGATGGYTRIGNMVFVYCQFTYPSTANGTGNTIGGLPFTVANQNYAQGGNVSFGSAGTPAYLLANKNATTFQFYNSSGTQLTNANLSTALLVAAFAYPIA